MKELTLQETMQAEHNQRLEDIKALMRSDPGRRILYWIVAEGRIFRPCFTGNSRTFYNEGARELALRVFHAIMDSCPEEFFRTQQEILRKEAEYAERNARTNHVAE